MVEVFRTNVDDETTAGFIVRQLQHILPAARVNFDLEDCDNILRIEWSRDPVTVVTKQLTDLGFLCEVLE